MPPRRPRPPESDEHADHPKMIQRVLVENWEAAKALDECHKKVAEIYARYEKG